MIRQVAKLPDRWIEAGRLEGAYIDPALKSPWRLFASWKGDIGLGYIGLLLTSESRATIRGWYVFPQCRKLGVGSQLLEAAVQWGFDSGRDTIEIRTARDVSWAGFEWTGYQRAGGNQERHYLLHRRVWSPCIAEVA